MKILTLFFILTQIIHQITALDGITSTINIDLSINTSEGSRRAKLEHSYDIQKLALESQPIRITFDKTRIQTNLTLSQAQYLDEHTDYIASFFQHLIKVQPLLKNNIFPQNLKCGNIVIDDNDKQVGIKNSDLHLYIYFSEIEFSSACILSETSGRPIFGILSFTQRYLNILTDQNGQEQTLKKLLKNQILQILGFSKSLFPYFVDRNGLKYSEKHYADVRVFQDTEMTFLSFPNIRKMAQTYFECSKIIGFPIMSNLNQINWLFAEDSLITVNNNTNNNKQLTLNPLEIAILKDSGWYQIQNNQRQVLQSHGTTGLQCEAFDQICKSSHQYFDLSTKMCNECHSHCKTCFGPQQSECLSCNHSHNMFKNECLRKCPENSKWDYHSQKCEDEREESISIACNNCVSGQICIKGLCYDLCEPGEYLKVINQSRVCQTCQNNCLSCISDKLCLKCSSGLKLLNGQCVQECEIGYYNNSSNVCQRCHSSCLSCKGSQKTECLSCSEEFLLQNGECNTKQKQQIAIEDNSETQQGQINEQKQLNQHQQNTEDSVYESKHFSTKSSHSSSHHGPHTVSEPHPKPPNHSEGSEHNGKGEKGEENKGKKTTDNNNGNNGNGSTTDKKKDNDENNKTCPIGFFSQQVTDSKICVKCSINCLSCQTYTMCSICASNYKSQNGSCVSKCGDHYYQTNKTCQTCHNSCLKCKGPLSNDCLSCKQGQKLVGGKCLSSGSFLEIKSNSLQITFKILFILFFLLL